MNKIILLTWVSWSWKTTLQEHLMDKYGYVKPINYTTRKPRDKKTILELEENKQWWESLDETPLLEWFTSKELDEYIFCTKDQFELKMRNWDFAEFTMNYWEYYWILNQIDYSKDNCIIVDPVWAAVFRKKFLLEWREFTSVFLDISEEEQEYRLWFKRRESVETIAQRKKDFLYFKDWKYDLVLNWEEETELIAMKLLNFINNK